MQISLLAFDVDGTLTDGTLEYRGEGLWSQRFHIHDGLGLKRLMEAGIEVAIITAKDFEATRARFQSLGIQEIHQGVSNKLETLKRLAKEKSIPLEACAFLGDDLPDKEVIEAVALGGAVADAVPEVKAAADYVCTLSGGKGAAREFADYVLSQNNGARHR